MRTLRARIDPFVLLPVAAAAVLAGASQRLLGVCGPFTDVAADAFCPYVLEIFCLGITTGTTPTTYDPSGSVSRLQMAAFLSRSVNTTLKRASRRTSTKQLWTPQNGSVLGVTTVGAQPQFVEFDGADLWVGNWYSNDVSRVRGSDARLLETWTGATDAHGVLIAMNRVLVSGQTNPGRLYMIDPSQPAGSVTTVASNLGIYPIGIAFDGGRVWTANGGPAGSVSIITPGASIPWSVTTLSVGVGVTQPQGVLYDGANIWVTDWGLGTLLKLDGSGSVFQTVTVGTNPYIPGFDGTNIWVPNFASGSVTVVRASSGAILRTLTGNGLNAPTGAGFDGERILVTNYLGNSVSLWRAADLSPLGVFQTGAGTQPLGVCSDGIRFWVTLAGAGLARF